MIELQGRGLTADEVHALFKGARVSLSNEGMERVSEAFLFLQESAKDKKPIYGVNTGFGYFAREVIPEERRALLQRNILLSHAGGAGDPFDPSLVRLMIALRLNVFLMGHSGVSPDLCYLLASLINEEIIPVVPMFGSVGASGDLIPLAHLALPLIGEGQVLYMGKLTSAKEALEAASIKPHQLKEKEGLALVNGTQAMLAIGLVALRRAKELLFFASTLSSMTMEALSGRIEVLDPDLHLARHQEGQIAVASAMRLALEGSFISSPSFQPKRVQDPYSLRCAPQVHGAALDQLVFAESIALRELAGATDNPLVFAKKKKVVSGGNFHGEPLALAFDAAALAVSELGNISERRLELLLNPHMSGFPAFLSSEEGVCSGYMSLQYLAASLVNECKLLANPSSTDSIPGNVGVEDFVSMGMTSARKLFRLTELLPTLFACELLASAEALHRLGEKRLGKKTEQLYQSLRRTIPPLVKDRIVSTDVNLAVETVMEVL